MVFGGFFTEKGVTRGCSEDRGSSCGDNDPYTTCYYCNDDDKCNSSTKNQVGVVAMLAMIVPLFVKLGHI